MRRWRWMSLAAAPARRRARKSGCTARPVSRAIRLRAFVRSKVSVPVRPPSASITKTPKASGSRSERSISARTASWSLERTAARKGSTSSCVSNSTRKSASSTPARRSRTSSSSITTSRPSLTVVYNATTARPAAGLDLGPLATIAEQPLHRALGLTDGESERIRDLLDREPNDFELVVFSLLWSEHCGYKHSRRLLGRLPTHGERVLQGPGENAGVIDLGEGEAVAFKVESHNHPSAVEPFQGAATGVGG